MCAGCAGRDVLRPRTAAMHRCADTILPAPAATTTETADGDLPRARRQRHPRPCPTRRGAYAQRPHARALDEADRIRLIRKPELAVHAAHGRASSAAGLSSSATGMSLHDYSYVPGCRAQRHPQSGAADLHVRGSPVLTARCASAATARWSARWAGNACAAGESSARRQLLSDPMRQAHLPSAPGGARARAALARLAGLLGRPSLEFGPCATNTAFSCASVFPFRSTELASSRERSR